jgi:hypothetical protein
MIAALLQVVDHSQVLLLTVELLRVEVTEGAPCTNPNATETLVVSTRRRLVLTLVLFASFTILLGID